MSLMLKKCIHVEATLTQGTRIDVRLKMDELKLKDVRISDIIEAGDKKTKVFRPYL